MELTINERKLEFKLGIGFLGELVEESEKSLEEVLNGIDLNPFKYVPLAMYVSARYALERKGKKADFTKFDFIEWIDKDGGITDKNKSAIEFLQALNKDLTKDVPTPDESKEEGPKKK